MASLGEELLYTTCRLEGTVPGGTSVGTGFFYLHEQRLFLVTNKHVVHNMQDGNFMLVKGEIRENQKYRVNRESYRIGFREANFIGHPNPDVDVAAMNISNIVTDLEAQGNYVYWKNITEKDVPTPEDIDKFISPIEEIVFIGYPSGIWDDVNILPVARKGITATPYYIDFHGEQKFLIDASVFPGSSGSPVFIYYAGSYPDKKGNLYAGSRIFFIGLVAQVYQRLEEGEIVVRDIPTQQRPMAQVHQMIDLGIVFKPVTVKETVEHYLAVVTTPNNQMQPTAERGG